MQYITSASIHFSINNLSKKGCLVMHKAKKNMHFWCNPVFWSVFFVIQILQGHLSCEKTLCKDLGHMEKYLTKWFYFKILGFPLWRAKIHLVRNGFMVLPEKVLRIIVLNKSSFQNISLCIASENLNNKKTIRFG